MVCMKNENVDIYLLLTHSECIKNCSLSTKEKVSFYYPSIKIINIIISRTVGSFYKIIIFVCFLMIPLNNAEQYLQSLTIKSLQKAIIVQ